MSSKIKHLSMTVYLAQPCLDSLQMQRNMCVPLGGFDELYQFRVSNKDGMVPSAHTLINYAICYSECRCNSSETSVNHHAHA